MWPIDKDSWQWSKDPDVLGAFNIPPNQLFSLAMPGEIVGTVTLAASEQSGLPPGLPVVVTANDKAVEALGAGLPRTDTGKHTALISLGTYIGGMAYGGKNVAESEHYFSNMAAIPREYLHECGGIRNGMANISWLKELFGTGLADEAEQLDLSPENLLNKEAAEVAIGADGLLTIPEWLAPPDQPFKRGAIIGLHNGHNRAHLYRSMLEAIALTMKNNLDAMHLELGRQADELIVSGGGANSDLFMQIFADVFGVPVRRNTVPDAAGLGSAICAAVAVGSHDSFASAINNMVDFADSFKPDEASNRIYDKINRDIYHDITTHTDRILNKI
ncbi:MAG: FGGY-family carbohydrate kinase [Gammaproteobacteria bacterium]